MDRIDLEELARLHGQSNLRFHVHMQKVRGFAIPEMGFFVGFTSSEDNFDLVECVVDDEGRYPSILHKDGGSYKVTLKALDASYGTRDYYVSDLESILTGGGRHGNDAYVAFLGTDVH
jgi:hypothetical protein